MGYGDGLAGRPAVHADAAYQQGWRVGHNHRRDLYSGLAGPLSGRPSAVVRVGVAAGL